MWNDAFEIFKFSGEVLKDTWYWNKVQIQLIGEEFTKVMSYKHHV
jgi:hypothetical protein